MGFWGFAVLEQLPKASRSFPVVVITNYDDTVTRDRTTALNVDGYFVKKDMTIKSLVEMVSNLLEKKVV